MTKKVVILVSLAIITFLVLSGCGVKKVSAPNQLDISNEARQRANIKRGEVDTINGETITVKLFEQQQRGERQEGNERPERTEGDERQRPEGNRQNSDRPSNQGERSQRQANFSGETLSITLTDNIKIYNPVYGDGSMKQEEISISDLKQGDIVVIRHSNDKNEISSIQLANNRK